MKSGCGLWIKSVSRQCQVPAFDHRTGILRLENRRSKLEEGIREFFALLI